MKNKTSLIIILLCLITCILCLGCNKQIVDTDEPQVDYQIELTKEERINIYDKDGNSLGTTSLDSIPYWIEKDNL